MSEYVVRPTTDADREAVIGIVGAMWQSDVRVRYEWLYVRNPHGRALTWIVVENDAPSVPVAITSIFPRHVVVGGVLRTGSIGGDCYVLPRARRKGLATKLHRASFAGMHERGVDFMYGPPRPNNLQALLKAGSNDVTMFRRWTRPLTGKAAVRSGARRDVPGLASVAALALGAFDGVTRPSARARSAWSLDRARAFGAQHTRAMDLVATSHRCFPVRDAEWLKWRYLDGPAQAQVPYELRRGGEIVGFVALERQGPRGVLVDAAVPNEPETLDATVELVLAEARALGCDALDASFTPGTPIVPHLGRRGFLGREEHGFQVALSSTSEEPARGELLDPRAWTFTDGDKDMDTAFSPEPDG